MLINKQAKKILKLQEKFVKIFYDSKIKGKYNFGNALNGLMNFEQFFLEDLILMNRHMTRKKSAQDDAFVQKFNIVLNQLKRDLFSCHEKFAELFRQHGISEPE